MIHEILLSGGKYNVGNKYYIKNQTVENYICAIDLEFRECKKDMEDYY